MVKIRADSERVPVPSAFFFFRATVASKLGEAEEKTREEDSRNWEVLGKKKEGKKINGDKQKWQLWFSVTPPQASCAIFNMQASVLCNLSCPGF